VFKKAKKTGSFLKTSLVRGVWFWAYMILGVKMNKIGSRTGKKY